MGLQHARRSGKILGRPKLYDSQEILRLRDEGHSYREISKRMGAPLGCISRAIVGERKTPSKPATDNSTNTRGSNAKKR